MSLRWPRQIVYDRLLDSTGRRSNRDRRLQSLDAGRDSTPLVLESSGRLSYRIPGCDDGRLVSNKLPADTWTHVAVTFDGSVKRVFLDGEFD